MTAASNHQSAREVWHVWAGGIVLLLLFGMAAAWKWTSLADLIDIKQLSGWAATLRESPARHLYLLGFYLVGALLLVPITVLILVTAIVFGPVMGSVYALLGSLAGALLTYAIGLFLGQDFVRKIAGKKWQRLERKIRQTGVVAVAALRLLPVAPFTVINIVSGAFKVPLRDYLFGSLVGLAPGILMMNLFAHQFVSAIRDPGIGTFLILAALVTIAATAAVWLKRRFES